MCATSLAGYTSPAGLFVKQAGLCPPPRRATMHSRERGSLTDILLRRISFIRELVLMSLTPFSRVAPWCPRQMHSACQPSLA